MNQNTRQRLIGTLVLAVAALILLPLIFDGEGSYQPVLQTEIPSRPIQPEPARTDPQRPVITADTDAIRLNDVPDTGAQSSASPDADDAPPLVAESSEQAPPAVTESSSPAPASPASEPAPAANTAATATNTITPALDNQGLPEGFSVRLGSFGNATNASNLVTRLQDAGHRAYTRRIESSQGMLTAVFVGPVVDRTTASALLESLRQAFALNGMIVRYEIEEL
ncbi:SPOR domain-containing protein [Pseudohongiella sp.]|uniref:SPOR domain-containing protein n=1 Tax=marine sediment metagenome TaxID=412755 RepID=A0A0F9WGX0_9ZZZZ|nr:SPOR domain-containing protein [Pseudohongiella sp.]